jgi:SAM-dependent methyltransferase
MRPPLHFLLGSVLSVTLAAACTKKEAPATSVDDTQGSVVAPESPPQPPLPEPTPEPDATAAAEADAAAAEAKRKPARTPDVEYVPTPQSVVDKMLELVKPKKTDVLYDLGCGDGRIVVTAAKKYGVKAFGYDIDPDRITEAQENVRQNGVQDLVTIEEKDIFTVDLSPANVVTLYLLPELNVKLIPQLEKLKPGSRIVSHDFDMAGVKPDKHLKFRPDTPAAREHEIYLFTAPLKKVKK